VTKVLRAALNEREEGAGEGPSPLQESAAAGRVWEALLQGIEAVSDNRVPRPATKAGGKADFSGT